MHLLLAHPGHELLLRGWVSRNKPVVHVLTDGSGHSVEGRLGMTEELLRGLGARPGAIFGRFSDRESYAMILECNTTLLVSLVEELAEQLRTERPSMLVSDAAEGYNPVHDLCRLIAGAAIDLAGVSTRHYEYPVVHHPRLSDPAALVLELEPAEYDAKIADARRFASVVPDIEDLTSRFGPDAYRYESLLPVADWTSIDDDEPPLYERFGEERVAAGLYTQVIRRREHMLPLRDALRAEVEKHSCAF